MSTISDKMGQIGALRRAEPADGQNIGVDPDMARQGVGGQRISIPHVGYAGRHNIYCHNSQSKFLSQT
jgi:hypothetical protein